MKGTRRGDFSRRFDPAAGRWDGVYLQQGRPFLDTDWNTQVDLFDQRLGTGLRDLIGPSGAPAHAPGFEIFALHPTPLPGNRHAAVRFPELPEDQAERLLARGFTFEVCMRSVSSDQPLTIVRSTDDDARFHLDLVQGRLRLDGEVFSTGHLPDGGLHHVSLCVQRSAVQVVANGRLIGRRRLGAEFAPTPGSTLLEVLASGEDAPGHQLLEARLWSFALSVEQIRSLGPLLPPRLGRAWSRLDGAELPRLLGWWRSGGIAGSRDHRLVDHGPHGCDGEWRGTPPAPTADSPPPDDTPQPIEIGIGPGRYYVDGITCELSRCMAFTEQPDFPGAEPPRVRHGESRSFLVYLDTWRRSISMLEDETLGEPALRGVDTAVRERTLGQVKWLPLSDGEAAQISRARHVRRLPLWRARHRVDRGISLSARVEDVPGVDLGNGLYRVEIHDGGLALGAPWSGHPQTARLLEHTADRLQLGPDETAATDGWRPGQLLELAPNGDEQPDRKPKLLFEVLDVTDRGVAELAPVRLPDFDASALPSPSDPSAPATVRWRPIASFKWANHNASSTYPICRGGPVPNARAIPEDPANTTDQGESTSTRRSAMAYDARLALEPTARGELDLAPGSFLELVDDPSTLLEAARPLWQVTDLAQGQIQIATTYTEVDRDVRDDHPYLRLWDQRGDRGGTRRHDGEVEAMTLTASGVVPVEVDTLYRLDQGPSIDFEAGEYRRGDYWGIEIRGRDLAWGLDDEGQPERRLPDGVDHQWTPLAVLHMDAAGHFDVVDLRNTFASAVDGFVGKVGAQTMEGPLQVDRGLIAEELVARGGRVVGNLDGELLRPHVVDRRHIVPKAVGLDELAPDVGVVPAGFFLLGPTTESPPGYAYTGIELPFYDDRHAWEDRDTLPGAPPGKVRTAVVGQDLYNLFEAGDVWRYRPATGTATPCPDMEPNRDFAVAAVDGKIHVVGGFDPSGRARDTHLVFDPADGSWMSARPLPQARGGLMATSFDGRLHVMGGQHKAWFGLRRPIVTTHDVYDPSTDQWFSAQSMPKPTAYAAAATTERGIHVVAGTSRLGLFGLFGTTTLNDHHLYLVHADRWQRLSPLPVALRDLSLAALGENLYALGGRAALGPVDDHHRYDAREDHWLRQRRLHVPMEGPGVGMLSDDLFVIGAPAAAGGVLVESRRAAARAYLHERL